MKRLEPIDLRLLETHTQVQQVNIMNSKCLIRIVALALALVWVWPVFAQSASANPSLRANDASKTLLAEMRIPRQVVDRVNVIFASTAPQDRLWGWAQKGLRPVLKRKAIKFFGKRTGSFLSTNGLLYEQIMEGFTGRSFPHVTLQTGEQFYAGRVLHAGKVGAALVLGPWGEVRYAAFIAYGCAQPGAIFRCRNSGPTLTIFTRSTISDAALAALRYVTVSMTPEEDLATTEVRVVALPSGGGGGH